MLLLRFHFNSGDTETAMHILWLFLTMLLTYLKIHIHVSFETLLSFTLLDCTARKSGDRCLLQRKQKAFSPMSRRQEAIQNKLAHWYTKALSKSFSRKGLVGNQKISWTAQRVTICRFSCEEAWFFPQQRV